MANIVGTGVFTTLGFQVLGTTDGFALLAAWGIGGLIAVAGALCYGELSAAIRGSGGEYRFLGRIYAPAVGTVAGCMVREGKLQRSTPIRVIRDGIVIYTGKLGSLKRFKDDVKEVVVGQDCGLNIESFNDIRVGDIVEGYEQVEVKRK